MNKIKLLYEAPEAETLVVRFEGDLLTGSDPKAKVNSSMSRGVDYDYDDLG